MPIALILRMATTMKDITDASIPQLISGVVNDAKEIAAGHATKARDEIKEEFAGLKTYLLKVAIAVGIGILGAILLAHAVALILNALGLPQWAAYLISAAIAIGAGVIVIKRLPADKKDIDLVPEAAIAGMKRDMKTLKDDVAHAT